MKLRLLTRLGLTAVSVIMLSIPPVQAFPTSVPQIEMDIKESRLTVSIPEGWIQLMVDPILQAHAGVVFATDTQTIHLHDLAIDLMNESEPSSFEVTGSWLAESRAKVVCLFNRCLYTPWASLKGRLNQQFAFEIKDGVLHLAPVQSQLEGLDENDTVLHWVTSLFNLEGQLHHQLEAAFQHIHEQPLQSFLPDQLFNPGFQPLNNLIQPRLEALSLKVANDHLIMTLGL